jgi:hypothetical protein
MTKEKHKKYQWIDGETADRITSLNLKDYRANLKSELAKWKKNPKTEGNPSGYWLHPDDVVGNMRRIEALNLIINDFVETSDEIK